MGFSGISIWQLLIMLCILLPLFFLPTIIATTKNHPHKLPIILINIFGGLFFGVGWVVALIWSFILPEKTLATTQSPLTEIERLHALMIKGALSQEEFNTQKKAVLGRQ